MFYVFWTHSDEYIELYEESQDGVRDKDVIDVNDDEEDTLEIAKYIFNIKILSFPSNAWNQKIILDHWSRPMSSLFKAGY